MESQEVIPVVNPLVIEKVATFRQSLTYHIHVHFWMVAAQPLAIRNNLNRTFPNQ